jgi:2-phospho-L-lactate guanylyltransferase (CobY/MobA/RfbA family)
LFPSHFGTGSYAKHCAEAERAGAQILQRRNPHLEMDVDDDGDLRALLRHDLSGTATGTWLQDSGVAERLRLASAAPASVAAKI